MPGCYGQHRLAIGLAPCLMGSDDGRELHGGDDIAGDEHKVALDHALGLHLGRVGEGCGEQAMADEV